MELRLSSNSTQNTRAPSKNLGIQSNYRPQLHPNNGQEEVQRLSSGQIERKTAPPDIQINSPTQNSVSTIGKQTNPTFSSSQQSKQTVVEKPTEKTSEKTQPDIVKNERLAKALYSYKGKNKQELTFNCGDVLVVLGPASQHGYYPVKNRSNGTKGLVLGQFIEMIRKDQQRVNTPPGSSASSVVRFAENHQTRR